MIRWLRQWWATVRAMRLAIRHANGERDVFRDAPDWLVEAVAAQDTPFPVDDDAKAKLRQFIIAARLESMARIARMAGA